jgi:hypothetical protein
MYICRKCNTPVDEEDRFCTGCGAYVGEPAVKKDNWEAVNNRDGYKEKREHVEVAIENNEAEDLKDIIGKAAVQYINDNPRSLVFFVKQPTASLNAAMEDMDLARIIKISAVVIFAVPSLISLIISWSLKIPNDLVDIILPFNLLGIDFKGMLNLPGSMYKSFLYSIFGFLALLPIMFSGIYFSARLAFNADIKPERLWKALILSFVPYSLSLLLFFAVSFISSIAANIILFIGMIVYLLSFFNVINAAFSFGQDRAVFLTINGLVLCYLFLYSYIYFFMK